MRGFLAVGALALLALFVGLDRIDFMDEREARDAVVAREMVADRDPLTPRLGGEPWFEKPAPGYAAEMVGAWLTPGSPLGPRVIRGLVAVALVLVVAGIGARHLGAGVGLCAAAALASSFALPLATRSDGAQLLASLLDWVAFGLLLDVLHGRRAGPRLPLAYLALAAAFVIAGPMAVAWPLGAIAATLALAGAWRHARRLQPLAGILIGIGVGLPWYGAMLLREGPAFAGLALGFPYAVHGPSPWYAAPARALGFLMVGGFPWSTLLPVAVLRATTVSRGLQPPGAEPPAPEAFFVTALWVALIPVLIAPGAGISAALPALPAAALLCGAMIERVLAGEALWTRAMVQSAWLFAITGTVAAIYLAGAAPRLVEAASEIRLLAAVFLLLAWAPALAAFVRRERALPALLALPVAIGAVLVGLRTLPALSGYLTTHAVSQAMAVATSPATPLALLDPPPPTLRLRFPGPLIDVADAVRTHDLAAALARLRGADGHAYVAFREDRQSTLARAVSPRPLEILTRTPTLVLARIRFE